MASRSGAASTGKGLPPGVRRFANGWTPAHSAAQVPASAVVLEDTSGNDWYLWFGTDGKLRTTEAATAEAAGFDWNSGGTVVGTQS